MADNENMSVNQPDEPVGEEAPKRRRGPNLTGTVDEAIGKYKRLIFYVRQDITPFLDRLLPTLDPPTMKIFSDAFVCHGAPLYDNRPKAIIDLSARSVELVRKLPLLPFHNSLKKGVIGVILGTISWEPISRISFLVTVLKTKEVLLQQSPARQGLSRFRALAVALLWTAREPGVFETEVRRGKTDCTANAAIVQLKEKFGIWCIEAGSIEETEALNHINANRNRYARFTREMRKAMHQDRHTERYLVFDLEVLGKDVDEITDRNFWYWVETGALPPIARYEQLHEEMIQNIITLGVEEGHENRPNHGSRANTGD